jgi:hypothetical protein
MINVPLQKSPAFTASVTNFGLQNVKHEPLQCSSAFSYVIFYEFVYRAVQPCKRFGAVLFGTPQPRVQCENAGTVSTRVQNR